MNSNYLNKLRIFLSWLIAGITIVFSQVEIAKADSYYWNYSYPDVEIPEENWVYDEIEVSGIPSNAEITNVDLYFSITHSSPTDITVDLEHPNGTEYRVWESIDPSNSRPSYHDERNITKFNGLGVNGKWRLWMGDFYTLDKGTFTYWDITIYYTVPQPDLEVTDIWTEPSSLVGNQSCDIYVKVKNIGNAPISNRFYTYLYIDGDLKMKWYTENLSAGGYIQPKYTTTLPAGEHSIKVVTDATSAISESNENNNEMTESYIWAGFPDLRVTNLSINPSTPIGAQPTEITWRVDNDGSVDIPVKTRFYTKLFIDDELKKTWYTDGLTTTQYTSGSYKGNFSLGNHTVKILTDATSVVSESDETNNEKQQVFSVMRIQPPTDLIATSISSKNVKLTWNWNYDTSVLYGFYIYRSKTNNFQPSNSNYIGYAESDVRYYNDYGITDVGTYYYKITAVDRYSSPPDDESIPSNQAFVTIIPPQDTTPPSAPTNLTVTNPANDDGTHLNLNWTASTDNVGVAYYRVYESILPNVSKDIWDAYYEPKTNNLQAYDLTKGKTYYYRVLAIDTSGNESPLSHVASGIPKDTKVPDPPTNLSALASDGYVSLSWDSSYVFRWNIYRKPGLNTSDYEKIGNTSFNSYTDYNVTNGTTYYYKITAETFDGIESPYSNIVSATPTPIDLAPSAPTGLASYADDRKITLVWRKDIIEEDLDGYNIYRNGRLLNSSPIKSLIYEDSGLTNGITYRYEVKAVDKGGNLSSGISVNATPNPIEVGILKINGLDVLDYYTDSKSNEPVRIEYYQKGQISYIEFEVVDVVTGKLIYSKELYEPPSTDPISGNPVISWDGMDNMGDFVPLGIYEFRLTAYQVIEPVKVLAERSKNKVAQSPTRRVLVKAKKFFEGLFLGQGDSRLGKAGFYASKFVPIYGDGSDILLGFVDFAQGHGFDWTTILLSAVGLALDLVPPAKGADALITLIKQTNRLCGKEVSGRLVKVAWEMAKDKNKRNALLKMTTFMTTEIELLPKLLENADDMTKLGEFFTKYGDEAGGLLKKFGDDLADEMFEVYKVCPHANLKEVWRVTRDKKGLVRWLEEGTSEWGWKHIKEKHWNEIITEFGQKTEDEVKDMIEKTVKEAEDVIYSDAKQSYQYVKKFVNKNGKLKEFSVIVSTKLKNPGRIITAHPGI